ELHSAELQNVDVVLGGTPIVKSVSLALVPGEFLALVGPNGSGKSTLLRTLYRALRPSAGMVSLNGTDLWRLPNAEVARTIAVVAQERPDEFDFSVADVVRMGRIPYLGLMGRMGASHDRICADALVRTGAAHLAERVFHTLSGGEKQRVLIARALAQEPSILVLDEPTNHLDISAQLEILGLAASLDGVTVVAALHDLNHAATYADRVAVIQSGVLVGCGTPSDVLTPALIEEVFAVRGTVGTHPDTGRPQFYFSPLAPEHPSP
ncbi:MAG: ABC transporter ATP-binding protein, partial [Bacteroidota bacterium]